MNIIKYEKKYYDLWDDFVKNSTNGTIFHTRKFLSYHGDRFNDTSILIYDNKRSSCTNTSYNGILCCVFPCCKVNDKYYSHRGSSHGGPVIADKYYNGNKINKIIECIIKYYNHNLELRIPESIFSNKLNDPIIYFFKKNNFKINIELSIYKKLSKENLFQDYGKRNLSYLKKILLNKDYTTTVTNKYEDYVEYYKLLVINMKKFNKVPTHSLEEFIKINKIYTNKEVILIVTKFKEKIIGGVWNILCNNVLYAFYIVRDYTHLNKNFSASLPLYYSFNYGILNNIKYYSFGICGKDNLNESLLLFKETLGGNIINRYYLYI